MHNIATVIRKLCPSIDATKLGGTCVEVIDGVGLAVLHDQDQLSDPVGRSLTTGVTTFKDYNE